MARKRKAKASRAAKTKANDKGKTPKKQDVEKADEDIALVVTSPKKPKLGTSETECEQRSKKYVPPFTGSRKIVEIKRDRLNLSRTGETKLNSQGHGKSPKFGSNTEEKVQEATNEGSNEENSTSSENRREKKTICHKTPSQSKFSSDVLAIDSSKDQVMCRVADSKEGECISTVTNIPEKGNEMPLPATPHLIEPNQTTDVGESHHEITVIPTENQKDEPKADDAQNTVLPENHPEKASPEVPKLSCIIRKFYGNLLEVKTQKTFSKIENAKIVSLGVEFESSTKIETGRSEHHASHSEVVGVFGEILSTTDTGEKPPLHRSSQTDKESKSEISAEIESSQRENVAEKRMETASADLCETHEENLGCTNFTEEPCLQISSQTNNESKSETSEKSESCQKENVAEEGMETASVDLCKTDEENLGSTNFGEELHLRISSENNNESKSDASGEIAGREKENVGGERVETSSVELCKTDEDDEQAEISTADDIPTIDHHTSDQEVPHEALRNSKTSQRGTVIAENMQAVNPNENKDNQSGYDDGKCDHPIENDAGTSTSGPNESVDKQSFAKEFEALEELLPKDDMGLFDDVINEQLKLPSVEKEIPDGNSTINFLINEVSSISSIVMNYQRAVEDMRKHYKLSSRY